jgi:hypothetical protein
MSVKYSRRKAPTAKISMVATYTLMDLVVAGNAFLFHCCFIVENQI